MKDKIRARVLGTNEVGKVIKVSWEEADELGAFEEDALTENDALRPPG